MKRVYVTERNEEHGKDMDIISASAKQKKQARQGSDRGGKGLIDTLDTKIETNRLQGRPPS